ncbi:MAG: transposase [Chloroflexota bacterium]
MLEQSLFPWRPPRSARSGAKRRSVSVRSLCRRPRESLSETDRQTLERALAEVPELARGYQLKISFGTIIAQRDVSALESWVQEAHSSGLTPFVAFANGLRTDWAAVTAALTLPWSTGLAEGHVHRLKLIKRQGYGRAKLDLLRRRVLAG